MSGFTYVSLFSGIGGFEQALNKLGGTCVFASEIDKFAAKAYETLYGEAPIGDITQIEAGDIPEHDLLVGGFPCQAFSVAGKRGGFEDARGTLFFEIARIAAEKQPKVLLLENVKGLVGHDKGRTLDTIVKTLNDIGYRVDFEVLNSKFFGVPQNRERIFIVAVREELVENEPWDNVKGATVVPKGKRRISGYDDVKTFNFDWPEQGEVTTRLRDILEPEVDEKYYLDEEKTSKLVTQLEEREEAQVLRPQRTEYGKEIRKDYEAGKIKESRHNMTELQPRKDGISNTLTTVVKDNYLAEPQMLGHVDEEKTSKLVAQLEAKEPDERMSRQAVATFNGSELPKEHGDIIHAFRQEHLKDGICPTLTSRPEGFKTAPLPVVIADPQMLGHVDGIKGHDAIKRTYSTEGISPTLTTMGGGHREPKVAEEQPKLNIVGHSGSGGQKGHVYDTSGLMSTLTATDYKQPKQIAQEVRPVLTPDRVEKRQNGRRFKDDGEESFTLTAQDRHGIALGEKPRYRIRKLTPLECWRLQGFPDEAHNAVAEAGISDSQRYKQAGNAVTVNVIEAIGKRLAPYL